MRIVLVGRTVARDRLRPALAAAGFEIIGEARTMEAAREQADRADAFVVAPDDDHADAGIAAEPLTARERDVLQWLSQGLSNKAIAARLAISDQTVKFHVAAIIAKLGAANRTDAVTQAIRRGLVDL